MKKSMILAIALASFAAVALAQPNQGTPPVTTKINLTMEQRHVIKESIKELKTESTPASKDVAVGDEIPKTVQLHTIPAAISDRISQVKNYSYFLSGSQIVLVDPKDSKVVEVID